jgi:hypothetical protein
MFLVVSRRTLLWQLTLEVIMEMLAGPVGEVWCPAEVLVRYDPVPF